MSNSRSTLYFNVLLLLTIAVFVAIALHMRIQLYEMQVVIDSVSEASKKTDLLRAKSQIVFNLVLSLGVASLLSFTYLVRTLIGFGRE